MNDTFDYSADRSSPDRTATRAAIWVWIVGAVETVVFGCMGCALSVAALTPLNKLEEILADHPMRENIDLEQGYKMLWMVAVLFIVLGLMPGIAYLALGFAVKARKAALTNFALMLLMTQSIVWGLILVINVGSGFVNGSPAEVTLSVLTLGTLVVLIVVAIRTILSIGPAELGASAEHSDPWNTPGP